MLRSIKREYRPGQCLFLTVVNVFGEAGNLQSGATEGGFPASLRRASGPDGDCRAASERFFADDGESSVAMSASFLPYNLS